MEAINLNEQNVDELKNLLEKQLQANPDIQYRFFNQDQEQKQVPESIERQLDKIQSDIEQLKAKIDLIFGDAVLINGQFRSITPKP